MKIGVRVMPRNEVLDSQGRAVEKILRDNGHTVETARVGKYVILDFKGSSKEDAQKKAKNIADLVLHNSLIETYQIEVIDG